MIFDILSNTPDPGPGTFGYFPIPQKPVPQSPHTCTSKLDVRWFTPIYNQRAIQKEEKQELCEEGGRIKYWEYHGSLAGIVCMGMVDTLQEVIIDGEPEWKGSLNRGSTANYSTIILVSRHVLRFYWGTGLQTRDPLLGPDGNCYSHKHPAYKGICYIVLADFFFGRERSSPPKIEIVVSRKPQQGVSINGVFEDHLDPQISCHAEIPPPIRATGWAWRPKASPWGYGSAAQRAWTKPL